MIELPPDAALPANDDPKADPLERFSTPHPAAIPGIPVGHDIVAMAGVGNDLFVATKNMIYVFNPKTEVFRQVTFKPKEPRGG